ncbi:Probable LRR receptor-like serine/threonine-protein kinase At1g74360 [Linum perenne]
MAHNQFTGSIPEEYGNLTDIQALDLSFNRLTGSIPSSLGELKYLLWLMLANNTLSGRIPSELGRCNSLLWLNLSNNRLSGTIPSQLMNIADILSATENFSERRIVGRGGFGTVYRGVLPNGRQVAVKKLLREGIEGEKEFRAEMEVLTGNGGHPNLVALHGWCLDGCQRILVYEFMEGGALEDLVADRGRLSWRRRAEIAVDVARALVFLHHECYPAVVHRDVKASNVLLDQEGRARVTDFGLARFVDVGGSHVSTMVAGTVGYVAPEYGQTWQATTKGDVYSYGVLLMELATGRRAVDGGEEECLVEWARRVMVSGGGGGGGGGGRGMVSAMEGAAEMWELLRIGVRCTAEAPQGRPNMKEVLGMLVKMLAGGYGGVDLPPPR